MLSENSTDSANRVTRGKYIKNPLLTFTIDEILIHDCIKYKSTSRVYHIFDSYTGSTFIIRYYGKG